MNTHPDKDKLAVEILEHARVYVDFCHKVRGYDVLGYGPDEVDMDTAEDLFDELDHLLAEWEEM